MKSSWLHGVMHGTRHHNILCFLLWQQILRITLYNRICVMSEALDITTLRELTDQVGQHRCKVLIWVVLMFDILFWFTFVFLKKIFLWFLSFQVVGSKNIFWDSTKKTKTSEINAVFGEVFPKLETY